MLGGGALIGINEIKNNNPAVYQRRVILEVSDRDGRGLVVTKNKKATGSS